MPNLHGSVAGSYTGDRTIRQTRSKYLFTRAVPKHSPRPRKGEGVGITRFYTWSFIENTK